MYQFACKTESGLNNPSKNVASNVATESVLIDSRKRTRSSHMDACGTNHEPGSGSAFINYYLSVNRLRDFRSRPFVYADATYMTGT